MSEYKIKGCHDEEIEVSVSCNTRADNLSDELHVGDFDFARVSSRHSCIFLFEMTCTIEKNISEIIGDHKMIRILRKKVKHSSEIMNSLPILSYWIHNSWQET